MAEVAYRVSLKEFSQRSVHVNVYGAKDATGLRKYPWSSERTGVRERVRTAKASLLSGLVS